MYVGFVLDIRWCVKSIREQDKCSYLQSNVTAKNYIKTEVNHVECIEGKDNYDCLEKIEGNQADIVTLDAGTAYYASINFVSTILMAEDYAGAGQKHISLVM